MYYYVVYFNSDLLDSTLNGYRTCAFAFGQTGAGKTFTMMGSAIGKSGPGVHSAGSVTVMSHRDKLNMGMVGRSIEYLFAKLESMEISKCKIKISCLEIYQEHVFDLFAEERGTILRLLFPFIIIHQLSSSRARIVACQGALHGRLLLGRLQDDRHPKPRHRVSES